MDFVTGAAINGAPARADVDGGTTTIRSAAVDLPATGGALTFRYYFSTTSSSAADSFRAYVENAAGARTLVFQKVGTARLSQRRGQRPGRDDTLGRPVCPSRVHATDGADDSRIEAAWTTSGSSSLERDLGRFGGFGGRSGVSRRRVPALPVRRLDCIRGTLPRGS